MLMARLRPDLQHLTLLAARRIRAARIRELEGRGAPELELEVCAATLVDVDGGDLAAGEADGRDGVDGLDEVESCEAFRRRVFEACDGECAGLFGEAAERGACVGGFALLAFKGVEDIEGLLSAEGIGQALADAEVRSVLQSRRSGSVKDADLNTLFVVWHRALGAAA